jgi:nonsense-mediated mRNA decay protein 3
MFCVECGKEAEIYQNGVCLNCYTKNHTFSTGPDIIDIIKCPHCGSFKYKNKWNSESFNEILIRQIKHDFNISKELKNLKIFTECEDEKNRLTCKISINGLIKNIEISEEHLLIIRIKNEVCDVCSKRFGGYHEAIIQIRSYKRKLSSEALEEIKSFVINLVKSLQDKGHRDLFISDIGEEHGDLDFYLSNKGLAYTIIKNIQENYGGEIKKSSKNIGLKDSKQMYRITYLIRIPFFRKGDFILYKKELLNILSISKDKANVLQLSNWNEFYINVEEIIDSKLIGRNELISKMILVNQTNEEILVMDPISYKIFEIKKPLLINFNSKKINVVLFDDDIFLIPEKLISER